jgi:hypothetical protein
VVASSLQTPPVPKPFPKPGQPPTTTTPAAPTPAPPPRATVPTQPAGREEVPSQAPAGTPNEASLGAPIYPTSEFLESFDAGRGQRYYLFGTNAAYTEIIGYYKNVMKNGGRTIFEAPAMQQWDLGKFQEQTMAYPPSIVVKDYSWNGSTGYLFVDGAKEKRFRTVIQIVPAAPGAIK